MKRNKFLVLFLAITLCFLAFVPEGIAGYRWFGYGFDADGRLIADCVGGGCPNDAPYGCCLMDIVIQ